MFRSPVLRDGRADIIRFRLLWWGRRFTPSRSLVSLSLVSTNYSACWRNEWVEDTTNDLSHAIRHQVYAMYFGCGLDTWESRLTALPTQHPSGHITDGVPLGYDQASMVYVEVARRLLEVTNNQPWFCRKLQLHEAVEFSGLASAARRCIYGSRGLG